MPSRALDEDGLLAGVRLLQVDERLGVYPPQMCLVGPVDNILNSSFKFVLLKVPKSSPC